MPPPPPPPEPVFAVAAFGVPETTPVPAPPPPPFAAVAPEPPPPPASPPNSPPNSPTRTPSVSVSSTPPVSPTRTPSISVSRTPPASPPPPRNSTTIYGVGSSNCSQACASSSPTTVYFYGGSIGTSTTLYTTPAGSGTISTGYFATDGEECWVYGGGAYFSDICCVIEGTMISTSPSSSVAVETLQIGDAVLSKNINTLPDADEGTDAMYEWSSDNINGTASTALVVKNTPIQTTGIYNFNNGVLYTTRTHNHLIKRDGSWRIQPSNNIVVGDIFLDINENEVEITSIEFENRSVSVYQLNVETDDVYYANDILTHNDK